MMSTHHVQLLEELLRVFRDRNKYLRPPTGSFSVDAVVAVITGGE